MRQVNGGTGQLPCQKLSDPVLQIIKRSERVSAADESHMTAMWRELQGKVRILRRLQAHFIENGRREKRIVNGA
jgi:hypothetical protein